MWIVAIGLSEISHTYAGPFDTFNDADDWVKANFNRATCHILRLNTPKDVANNLRELSTEN